jgi:hypothetical protein
MRIKLAHPLLGNPLPKPCSTMKYRLYITLFLLLCTFPSFAQVAEIKGSVKDTVHVKPVVYASVSLLRKSDSILQRYTRSNQQGKFTFTNIPSGEYILLIAHSQYIDFIDDILFDAKTGSKTLDEYALIQRGQVLKELIIKNTAGIKIKGDTLEYLADSFKVREGAMVEDLLKVLPGIQVNKKGEITAHGEKVEKVLVDGEEFFGDDPTIATQNIQSKVVDKVQVFDKKSDQAAFTGFDDGQEQKTINLKLKDNMNRGEFGKVELAAGLDDRWQNQAMINSFKNKRQMSLYGLMSSNGKTGLGWEDRNKYTGDGGNMQMDEDGGFMWNFNNDDDDGPAWGNATPEGITKAWVGGAHFADKWNEQKEHLNTNYSFGRINRTKRENSITENLFPGNNFQTLDTNSSFSSRNTHRLTGKYEFMIDSSLTIIYNLNARLSFLESNSKNYSQSNTYNESPINNRRTIQENKSRTARANNQFTLNKKLAKVGRTISWNTSFNYNNNIGDGSLSGSNGFLAGGNPINQIIDQQKEDELTSSLLSTDITYTEPLTKKVLLKTSYGFGLDNSASIKSTFIQPNGNNAYTERVDSLSSEFNSTILSHTVGAEIKFTEKKI